MSTHELKTDPEVFDAVASGAKTHEIRRNDRGFQVGDVLVLRKTRYTGAQMHMRKEQCPLEYIGEPLTRTVSHVLTGYGLQDGWCILSFATAKQEQSVPDLVSANAERTHNSEAVRGEPQQITDAQIDRIHTECLERATGGSGYSLRRATDIQRAFARAIEAAVLAALPRVGAAGQHAHSKSEYKRRVAQGDPNVLPPVGAVNTSGERDAYAQFQRERIAEAIEYDKQQAKGSLAQAGERVEAGKEQNRFQMTYCSQCGAEQGPGDEGVSHCSDHRGKEWDSKGGA